MIITTACLLRMGVILLKALFTECSLRKQPPRFSRSSAGTCAAEITKTLLSYKMNWAGWVHCFRLGPSCNFESPQKVARKWHEKSGMTLTKRLSAIYCFALEAPESLQARVTPANAILGAQQGVPDFAVLGVMTSSSHVPG